MEDPSLTPKQDQHPHGYQHVRETEESVKGQISAQLLYALPEQSTQSTLSCGSPEEQQRAPPILHPSQAVVYKARVIAARKLIMAALGRDERASRGSGSTIIAGAIAVTSHQQGEVECGSAGKSAGSRKVVIALFGQWSRRVTVRPARNEVEEMN